MKGLLEVIEKRRARRALSDKPIPEDIVKRLMTAATYAPSCSNKQPWRFVAVTGEGPREKVRDALLGGNYWARKAPLFVLAATKPELDCQLEDRRDYAFFDVGQAIMSLQYQAIHEGLYAHPIAGFKDVQLKEAFGIPDEYVLLGLVVIGYPGDDADLNDKHKESERSERSRKDQSEVVSFDSWSFDA